MFCSNCGKEIDENAVVCVHCGCPTARYNNYSYRGSKSMAVAVLLWFFLGHLGVHRFYLGHAGTGMAQLLLTVVGWATIVFLIGAIPLLILVIWWIVDIFSLVSGNLRPADGSELV